MRNTNYAPEIATANQFIIDHNYDAKLIGFLRDRQENLHKETHSDRWSLIFDFMSENYPGATGSLITGLSYYVED